MSDRAPREFRTGDVVLMKNDLIQREFIFIGVTDLGLFAIHPVSGEDKDCEFHVLPGALRLCPRQPGPTVHVGDIIVDGNDRFIVTLVTGELTHDREKWDWEAERIPS